MMPLQVAGFGEVLWDLLPSGKQLGGAPANFAYFCGVLGASAQVVSAVGDDELGHEILIRLGQIGLASEHIQIIKHRPTGTVEVQLNSGGIPSYIIHEDVAWDCVQETDDLAALAPKLDALCFGTLSQRSAINRKTLEQLLSALRPGCLRVFDVNLRQRYYDAPTIRWLMQRSNVVKLNYEELPIIAEILGISNGDDSEMLREIVARYSLHIAALTRGAHGSRLQTAN